MPPWTGIAVEEPTSSAQAETRAVVCGAAIGRVTELDDNVASGLDEPSLSRPERCALAPRIFRHGARQDEIRAPQRAGRGRLVGLRQLHDDIRLAGVPAFYPFAGRRHMLDLYFRSFGRRPFRQDVDFLRGQRAVIPKGSNG